MLKGLVANLVRYSIWSAVLPDALQSSMTIRQELSSSLLEIPYDACDLFSQVLIGQVNALFWKSEIMILESRYTQSNTPSYMILSILVKNWIVGMLLTCPIGCT